MKTNLIIRGQREYIIFSDGECEIKLNFRKTQFGWYTYLTFNYTIKKDIYNLTQFRTPPKSSWSDSQFKKDYIKHEDKLNKAYIEIVFGDKKDLIL